MHGIMTGEIQALEGAGRTAHDFASGDGTNDTIPFELKLDMARQAWDEARHVEISVKLSAWMGTETRPVRGEHRPVPGGLLERSRSCGSPASTAPSRAWRSTCSRR